MPTVSSVTDIKDMDDGDIVKCFRGKITKMTDYKSGKNDNGPWSFQHLTVEDDDGKTIKLTLKKREELPDSWKGREIVVSAHKGKNDWTGLYAKDDTYDGKTSRILLATATADLERADRSDNDTDGDDEPKKRRSDDEDDRPKRRSEDEDDRPKRRDDDERSERKSKQDPVDAVADQILRISNLYGMALDAACEVLNKHEERNGVAVPPEVIYTTATTMFIQLRKDGWGDELPTEPLWEEEKTKEDEGEADEKKGGDDEDDKPVKKKRPSK